MDNKATISVLNDLIETCLDGHKGFAECADDLKNPELKRTMMVRSQDCSTAASELQQMVTQLGGEPEQSSSVSGALHRKWVDIKSAITGKSDEAILNECERGEDVALKAYKEAVQKDLPADVRTLIERQLQGVQRNHDQVKALRDAERARS